MWDAKGGLGSTKTHVKNGFCIEDGAFKWPNYKLPKFFVKQLNNTHRKIRFCRDTSSDLRKKCERILEHTFQPSCITRSIKFVEHMPTYEKTYILLHDKKTKYDVFEEFMRNKSHASVHDNLGKFTISSNE